MGDNVTKSINVLSGDPPSYFLWVHQFINSFHFINPLFHQFIYHLSSLLHFQFLINQTSRSFPLFHSLGHPSIYFCRSLTTTSPLDDCQGEVRWTLQRIVADALHSFRFYGCHLHLRLSWRHSIVPHQDFFALSTGINLFLLRDEHSIFKNASQKFEKSIICEKGRPSLVSATTQACEGPYFHNSLWTSRFSTLAEL